MASIVKLMLRGSVVEKEQQLEELTIQMHRWCKGHGLKLRRRLLALANLGLDKPQFAELGSVFKAAHRNLQVSGSRFGVQGLRLRPFLLARSPSYSIPKPSGEHLRSFHTVEAEIKTNITIPYSLYSIGYLKCNHSG